jgi:regulator of protease activity HflC (stomatin/prohibitin superfamily)
MTFDTRWINAALGLAALWWIARAVRRLYISAQPDEWLLCVRNGALVNAGVGVSMLRRPGDVVVRFSSTLQRVGFAVEAISLERVAVRIEGFIFWSVASEGDAPFRAYSRLGIANLMRPPFGLKHPKHLLTSPQHKAFQQILSAVVQRHASTLSLDALIGRQDALVAGLTERLREVTAEMGAHIDQVEVLAARPADAVVQGQLSSAETERIREEAERVRREVAARIASAELESTTRAAQERAEQERAAREAAIERERTLELAQVASQHQVRTRAVELERAHALAQEALALEVARARRQREREESDARLALVRAEAEAQRDAETARAAALEGMSPAVREHERAVLIAEKVAATLKVTDARWVSVGAESPAASVGAMIAGVREVLEASSHAS